MVTPGLQPIWSALLVGAGLAAACGVWIASQRAQARLEGVIANARAAYLQACAGLPKRPGSAEAPTPEEGEAVFRCALLLVRLVDALYVAKDPAADDWAIRLDDYSACAPEAAERLLQHASDRETRAAIGEAWGRAGEPVRARPAMLLTDAPPRAGFGMVRLTAMLALALTLGAIAGAAGLALGYSGVDPEIASLRVSAFLSSR